MVGPSAHPNSLNVIVELSKQRRKVVYGTGEGTGFTFARLVNARRADAWRHQPSAGPEN